MSDAQSGASCHSSSHGEERWAAACAGSVHVLPTAEQDVSESASCRSTTSARRGPGDTNTHIQMAAVVGCLRSVQERPGQCSSGTCAQLLFTVILLICHGTIQYMNCKLINLQTKLIYRISLIERECRVDHIIQLQNKIKLQ